MRRAIDVDEGVVVALVGEVARPLLVDIVVDFSEFGSNIGHVVVVRVDDVMSFLDDLEKLS